MAQRIFVLSTLLPGVEPADYEEWMRTVDVPVTRQIQSIQNHAVTRLTGPLLDDGPIPYHYVEIIDVSDVDQYRKEISDHPEASVVMAEFSRFVGSSAIVYGDVLDIG